MTVTVIFPGAPFGSPAFSCILILPSKFSIFYGFIFKKLVFFEHLSYNDHVTANPLPMNDVRRQPKGGGMESTMQEFSSCKQAIQSCLDTKTFAVAHLYHDEKPMAMHIHDSYEIYFSISGGKQFLIDNRFYDINPGDIFFINQFESHYLTQIDQAIHERILLSIYPDFLKGLSTQQTDLDYCFHTRSIPSPHRVRMSEPEQKRFIYFIHRLTQGTGFGSDIVERAVFSELMVFLNQLFYRHGKKEEEEALAGPARHRQVDDILRYINQNIQNNLTIEELSKHFYLSASYLCRIFKSATGMTINKYITAKRITLSKALLAEGCSVNEACERCGFGDYSNFLKAFTKAVGISPKKYAQFNSV